MLFDQHLHSWHSMDSETPPRENVLQALQVGLKGLTFTEHFDTHPHDWPMSRYNDDEYSRMIGRLRAEFGHQIFIGKGIEVCYQPARADFILGFLERHEFDMVLLSIHWAQGKAFWIRDHWGGLSVREAAGVYFQTVLEAVRWAGELRRRCGRRVFDVLGHLDFIKRYAFSLHNDHRVIEGHEKLIDEILIACLEAELIPEINTSPLRSEAPEAMPGPATVRRYAVLGGRAVSLGSDAHRADAIGAHFAEVVGELPSLGIRSTVQFKCREATHVQLNS